ncbi:MAG: site-specific integrase [Rhodocyclaceae bacterium]|nr:site-specific integrase [Rhodocyclaceae bacterium]MCA3099431.1 site-specific integrase [Rhodocyclaceae bacterium]MCA3102818.1 site-specific integrase [Rhodocyclaceae bacterium]MCA3111461.1 site-specific integrase [Rhodocyclaceae bacterium]MCA3119603.1 site-specific integrase [Rhodocyclaceae bacterium]
MREVLHAPPGDHSDGAGLRLQVDACGARWLFRFTSPDGARREMGLGGCERANMQTAGASLTAARAAAAKARAMLAEVPPRDPIEDRKAAKEAAKAAVRAAKAERTKNAATLARVARGYHERVIEPSRSAKHGGEWIRSMERLVPPHLWHAPIATIEAPALLDAMADLYQRVPETASRIRQRLEAVFDDAVFRGICGRNPAAAIKRKVREGQVGRDVESHRALAVADVPGFVQALRAQPGIAARALEFAMLTAARTGEIIGATWSEIDAAARLWTIPAARMKAGEEHRVPLCPRALQIIDEMRSVNGAFLFPNPRDTTIPMSNMAMLSLLKRMGWLDRTTAHGVCRSTFSTWANETGIARPDVIEACLAHKEGDRIRAAYNRAKFNEERRALLVAWSEYQDGRLPVAKVLPIMSRAVA